MGSGLPIRPPPSTLNETEARSQTTGQAAAPPGFWVAPCSAAVLLPRMLTVISSTGCANMNLLDPGLSCVNCWLIKQISSGRGFAPHESSAAAMGRSATTNGILLKRRKSRAPQPTRNIHMGPSSHLALAVGAGANSASFSIKSRRNQSASLLSIQLCPSPQHGFIMLIYVHSNLTNLNLDSSSSIFSSTG